MFVRHVIQLGLANVGAQTVSLLVVPILTRLYSPSDFGVFAIYLAAVNTLVPIASLRYQAAIALPKEESEARRLLHIALLILAAQVVLTGVVVTAVNAGFLLPAHTLIPKLAPLLWLLPPTLGALGLIQAYGAWIMRHQLTAAAAVARITESLSDRATSLLCAVVPALQPAGLVAGRLAGASTAAWSLWKAAQKVRPSKNHAGYPVATLISLATRYRHFAVTSSVATLCDSAARQTPAILLAVLFSPAVAGYYAVAFQVVNVPLLVAGDALASTFFQRAAGVREHPDRMAHDTARLFRAMLNLIIPVTLALSFLGPLLFRQVFGQEWTPAGEYAQILAVGFLFMFLHRPISVLFDVYEAQTARLWFDLVNLGLRTTAILGLTAARATPQTVLTGFTVVSAGLYGIALVYLLNMAGLRPRASLAAVIRQTTMYLPLASGLGAIALLDLSALRLGILLLVALFVQAACFIKYEGDTLKLARAWTPATTHPR